MKYRLYENSEGSNITVFLEDDLYSASNEHPNFERILEQVRENNEVGLVELFDPAAFAASKFRDLGERVSVADGRIYFDGDLVDNALSRQIWDFIQAGQDDWEPLVKFYERLMTNTSESARNELYRWLNDRKFEISPDGRFFAYKGLTADGGSIHHGPAVVDGVAYNGSIPNAVGSTITFPRANVDNRSDVGCSVGLHAGTWEYASDFGRGGKVVKVLIDPRDVVSVPTDCSDQKLRVCRYVVVEEVVAPSDAVVDYRYGSDQEGDEYNYEDSYENRYDYDPFGYY